MFRRIYLPIIVFLTIFVGIIIAFTIFKSRHFSQTSLSSESCDELSALLDEEYNQLDFSCRQDNECVESDVKQCDCKGANTNTQKAKEIDKILQEKKCLRVQIQCRPFECKCINKVCTKVKVGW